MTNKENVRSLLVRYANQILNGCINPRVVIDRFEYNLETGKFKEPNRSIIIALLFRYIKSNGLDCKLEYKKCISQAANILETIENVLWWYSKRSIGDSCPDKIYYQREVARHIPNILKKFLEYISENDGKIRYKS